MKRVLFITSALDRNGTETFIMNVFRHIDRSKFMFDFLLTTKSTIGYYGEAEKLGAKIYRIPSRKEGLFKYISSLKNFFSSHSKDYVAIHWCGNSLSSIAPIYLAYKFRIPIRIVHSHNSNTHGIHNILLHMINRRLSVKLCTNFMACSQVASDYFYKNTNGHKDCLIIKNGIDLSKYQYNEEIRNELRNKMNLNDSFVIGHVGRFTKVKNHTFIVDVFVEILKKRKAVLMLIGVGEDFEAIQTKVSSLGIEKSVLFLGLRDDVPELLQAMDCFLFPSFYEGLPFALIEAQAAGLSVFTSTNVSREVELTKDISFMDLNDSPKDWAYRILDAKTNRNGRNSELIAQAGYSISDTAELLAKIYSQDKL